jgi:hypothetical protein
VRVTLRPGAASPERLRRQIACQKELIAARPQVPGSCPFIDLDTETQVSARDGQVTVDLQRAEDVDLLREQVRTALGAGTKPTP